MYIEILKALCMDTKYNNNQISLIDWENVIRKLVKNCVHLPHFMVIYFFGY